jgi:hypothetical protein
MSTQNMTTGPVTLQGDQYFLEYRQYANGGIQALYRRADGSEGNCCDPKLDAKLSDAVTANQKNVEYDNYNWAISIFNGATYVWKSTMAERRAWLDAHPRNRGEGRPQAQTTLPTKMYNPQMTTSPSVREYQLIKMIPPEREGDMGTGMEQINAHAVDGFRIVSMCPLMHSFINDNGMREEQQIVIVAMER